MSWSGGDEQVGRIFFFLALVGVVCLAGCAATPGMPGRAMPPETDTWPGGWSPVELEIMVLINRQRMLHGLPVLQANARLHRVARLHSREMAAGRYLGHDSPGGRDFSRRAQDQGYHWQRIAENVALLVLKGAQGELAHRVLFGTDQLVELRSFCRRQGLPVPHAWAGVGRGWGGRDWNRWQRLKKGRGGWMGSAGHRENILLPLITDIGVGYAARDDAAGWIHHYFTVDFAAPASNPARSTRGHENAHTTACFPAFAIASRQAREYKIQESFLISVHPAAKGDWIPVSCSMFL